MRIFKMYYQFYNQPLFGTKNSPKRIRQKKKKIGTWKHAWFTL